MNYKSLAKLIILSTLALIIGVIESLIPPILPFLPFVRIGLANIVIIYAYLLLGSKQAYTIAIIKSIFTGLILGNPIMILYSLPSSLISLTTIILLFKANKNSLCAISSVGAVVHNLAQLVVAAIMTGTIAVVSYAPYFIIVGAIAGYVVGVLVLFLSKRVTI